MTSDIITFGCRLNTYESEVIRRAVGEADIAVFNTCAVTKEAERQARQAIRRYSREHPGKQIFVTGCAAQINPKPYAEIAGVTRVLGNEEKFKAESYGSANDAFGEEKVLVNDIMSVTETASHLVTSFEGRARAFVQVQNGCNHRCTFCIIPYGRGNSRSVPIGEIVKEVEGLVENGFKEVVITGVDITDYGKDLPGQPSLGNMLARVLKLVPNLPRLRLSSVDVAEIDHELLDLIANEPRLMPHLHISMQAGDDLILKRMKRRHLRQDILDFCAQIRRLRPDVVFGADIITGFPTETDALFQNTYDCVEEAHISWLHVFPYSEREGTPAARIPNQVPPQERKARAARLRGLGDKLVAQTLQNFIGTTQQIIVEQDGLTGHTPHYAKVTLPKLAVAGDLINIPIQNASANCLIA
jgi:threonylcarbamoyladenosine tRNA methylthiotransferase MtaB